MKKLILLGSFVVLVGTAAQVSAQKYDSRVDVSRLANEESRTFRGDRDRDRDGSAAANLERLNREVRQVRNAIGDSRRGMGRIRERFHRVVRATDFLNDQFRRGRIRGWEVRRRADAIRADLDDIRRDLRARHIGLGGWR